MTIRYVGGSVRHAVRHVVGEIRIISSRQYVVLGGSFRFVDIHLPSVRWQVWIRAFLGLRTRPQSVRRRLVVVVDDLYP